MSFPLTAGANYNASDGSIGYPVRAKATVGPIVPSKNGEDWMNIRYNRHSLPISASRGGRPPCKHQEKRGRDRPMSWTRHV
jgi:hypothetical protein